MVFTAGATGEEEVGSHPDLLKLRFGCRSPLGFCVPALGCPVLLLSSCCVVTPTPHEAKKKETVSSMGNFGTGLLLFSVFVPILATWNQNFAYGKRQG